MTFGRLLPRAGLGLPVTVVDALEGELENLEAGALDRDASAAPPPDLLRGLLDLGTGAARIPQHRGGWGLSIPQYVHLITLIARTDPGVAQALRSHFAFVERTLGADPVAHPEFWLEEALQGRMFAGATTEPPGQAAGSLETHIRWKDDQWFLYGAKAYCTGSAFADWLNVLAGDGSGQRYSVLVRTDQSGVSIKDDWAAFGQRVSASGGAEFCGVQLDARRVRRIEDASGLHPSLNDAFLQLTHLATLCGILVRIYEDAVSHTRGNPRHFSHAASDRPELDPVVQQIIGVLSARVATAFSLTLTAAETLDDSIRSDQHAAAAEAHRAVTQAQVIIPELVTDSASKLFDIGGGSLVTASRRWDRHWRNARTLASHNPAVQKARVLGAEALLDEPLPGVWYAGNSPAKEGDR